MRCLSSETQQFPRDNCNGETMSRKLFKACVMEQKKEGVIKFYNKLSESALNCTKMCRKFTEINVLARFPVVFEKLRKEEGTSCECSDKFKCGERTRNCCPSQANNH